MWRPCGGTCKFGVRKLHSKSFGLLCNDIIRGYTSPVSLKIVQNRTLLLARFQNSLSFGVARAACFHAELTLNQCMQVR